VQREASAASAEARATEQGAEMAAAVEDTEGGAEGVPALGRQDAEAAVEAGVEGVEGTEGVELPAGGVGGRGGAEAMDVDEVAEGEEGGAGGEGGGEAMHAEAEEGEATEKEVILEGEEIPEGEAPPISFADYKKQIEEKKKEAAEASTDIE